MRLAHNFYELLIKTDLKVKNYLDLKHFLNDIKTCLNELTRLQEDLIPYYRPSKDTLRSKNTSSCSVLTRRIPMIHRYTRPLDTQY